MNIGQAIIGPKPQFGDKLLGTVNVIEPSEATVTLFAATKPPIKTVSVVPSEFEATPLIVTLVPTGPLVGVTLAPVTGVAGGIGGTGGIPLGGVLVGCIGGWPGGIIGNGWPGQRNRRKFRVNGPKKPVALDEAAMPFCAWKLTNACAVIGPKKPVTSPCGRSPSWESTPCSCVTSLPLAPIERLRLKTGQFMTVSDAGIIGPPGVKGQVLDGFQGILEDGAGINGGTLIPIVLDPSAAPSCERNDASWLRSEAIWASRAATFAEPDAEPYPVAETDWADAKAGTSAIPTTATPAAIANR